MIDDSWIDQALVDARECLMKDELPEFNSECELCNYRALIQEVEKG